jgi:hypothetical protein
VSSNAPAVALHGFVYSTDFGDMLLSRRTAAIVRPRSPRAAFSLPFASRTFVRYAGIDCAAGPRSFFGVGVGPIQSSFQSEVSIGRFLQATAPATLPQLEPVRQCEISETGL